MFEDASILESPGLPQPSVLVEWAENLALDYQEVQRKESRLSLPAQIHNTLLPLTAKKGLRTSQGYPEAH